MKIKRIDTINEKHSYISIIPTNETKSQYYTITTKTGFSILVEPYLKLDSSNTTISYNKSHSLKSVQEEYFEIGSVLFALLKENIKDSDELIGTDILICNVVPFTLKGTDIFAAKRVYVFVTELFNTENFFKNLKYVNKDYKTKAYEILEVTRSNCIYDNLNNEEEIKNQIIEDVSTLNINQEENNLNNKEIKKEKMFYEITKDTVIHFTNTKPFELYGYESYEKTIQEKIYSTLFCRNELEKHKLAIGNIVVLKGNKDVRLQELSIQITRNLQINSVVLDFNSDIYNYNIKNGIKGDCKTMIKEILEKKDFGPTVLILENCFEKSVVDFYGVCDFINNNKQFVYVFLVHTNEEAEKIVNVFSKNKKFENDHALENIPNSCGEAEKVLGLEYNEIEIHEIKMPVITDITLLRSIVSSFPNELNLKDYRELFKTCNGFKINVIENVIRDAISKILYKMKNDTKCENKSKEYENHIAQKKYKLKLADLIDAINEKKMKKNGAKKIGFFKKLLRSIFK